MSNLVRGLLYFGVFSVLIVVGVATLIGTWTMYLVGANALEVGMYTMPFVLVGVGAIYLIDKIK